MLCGLWPRRAPGWCSGLRHDPGKVRRRGAGRRSVTRRSPCRYPRSTVGREVRRKPAKAHFGSARSRQAGRRRICCRPVRDAFHGRFSAERPFGGARSRLGAGFLGHLLPGPSDLGRRCAILSAATARAAPVPVGRGSVVTTISCRVGEAGELRERRREHRVRRSCRGPDRLEGLQRGVDEGCRAWRGGRPARRRRSADRSPPAPPRDSPAVAPSSPGRSGDEVGVDPVRAACEDEHRHAVGHENEAVGDGADRAAERRRGVGGRAGGIAELAHARRRPRPHAVDRRRARPPVARSSASRRRPDSLTSWRVLSTVSRSTTTSVSPSAA